MVEAMHFKDTRVAGALIIDINPHHDDRGRFLRAWCVREFEEQGIHFLPVQANMQFSPRKGTVRGLHLQGLRRHRRPRQRFRTQVCPRTCGCFRDVLSLR